MKNTMAAEDYGKTKQENIMANDYFKAAQEIEPELTQFLRDIVAIPSLSGEEGDVAKRIKAEMEKLGYDEVTIDPQGNVIGRIGSGSKVIALDGHIDTVDIGEIENWNTDPYDPVLKDGVIYGRGTTDMKGGVASSVYAGAILKKLGLPKDVTLYVTGTVQEEDCDGLCWQYIYKEDKIEPNVVVITEPTSLRIYRGHRGRMEMELSTAGVSCHGSAPERGVNAVYKMADIIKDIEQLNERLEPRAPLGKGTITISHIRSTSPSLCAVADGCTIHLDRRLTIGETEETSVQELLDLPSVKKAGGKVKVLEYNTPSYTGLVYPTKKYYPTWEMPESEMPVQKAVAAYKETFSADPEVGHWTFSTNGVSTAGMYGIPTIGFGPGHEKFAHAPNEEVEVDHLVRAAAFYAGFVDEFAKG